MQNKETAVARYQRIWNEEKRRPNKRLRRRAWKEANALIADAMSRDRRALDTLRDEARRVHIASADALYGAQKYGRDVSQPLVIPTYREPLPSEPEHGFRFISVLGKRRHLWYEGAWVELSGALMREVGSSGLRTALADACRFQEARHHASTTLMLRFRDQVIDVKRITQSMQDDAEWWPHQVPLVG